MLVKLMLTCALWHSIRGLGVPEMPEMPKSFDAEDLQMMQDCLGYIKCAPGAQEYIDEFDRCTTYYPEGILEEAFEYLSDKFGVEMSNFDEFTEVYCKLEKTKQAEVYSEISRYAFERYSSECGDSENTELCKQVEKVGECNAKLSKKAQEDGEC